MISLLKLRQNGLFDVFLFLLLDIFSKGNSYDTIANEFIYILFVSFIIFYDKKFTKNLEMICFIVLNIIIFFDRTYFSQEANKMINLFTTICLYVILSNKLKK